MGGSSKDDSFLLDICVVEWYRRNTPGNYRNNSDNDSRRCNIFVILVVEEDTRNRNLECANIGAVKTGMQKYLIQNEQQANPSSCTHGIL